MTTRPLSLLTLLALAAGCSAEAATPSKPEPAATDPVVIAVTIVKAIRAAPTKADSILIAWDQTADSFEKLLAEISRDSTRSVRYSAAMK
jgi:hypothetical protein